MKEELFDSKIRAMLGNGEEEVPAGLWDAIEDRLPSSGHSRAVWFRRCTVAVAIAASLALALLLPFRQEKPDIGIVAPSAQQEVIAEQVSEQLDIEPAKSLKPQAVTTVPVEMPSESVASESVASEICEEVPVTEPVSEHITVEADDSPAAANEKRESIWSDSASFPEDDVFNKNSSGIELTASYNATSNNNPSSASANGAVRRYSHSNSGSAAEEVVETGSSRYAIPVSFGLGINIPLSEKFSIGTGLNLSILNRSFAGKYTTEDGSTYSYSDISNRLLYLGIPVNVYYSFTKLKMIDLYAYAGGTVEKCISNSYRMSGVGGNFSFKEAAKGVQASANLGIGVEFLAFRHLGFYFDPSLRYYFNCNQPVSIRTQQPFMMGFEIGLRYKL